jgi:hypothetical protein
MNYGEIVAAVESIAKQFTGKKQTMIEYLVNMVYLDEIMAMPGVRPFFWLMQLGGKHLLRRPGPRSPTSPRQAPVCSPQTVTRPFNRRGYRPLFQHLRYDQAKRHDECR